MPDAPKGRKDSARGFNPGVERFQKSDALKGRQIKKDYHYMSNGTLAVPQLGLGNLSKTSSARLSAPDIKRAAQVPGARGLPAAKAVAGEKSKKGVKPFPTKPLIVLCNSVAAMLDAQ